MTPEITIRRATAEDSEAIHRFLLALVEETDDASRFRSTPETVVRDGFGPVPQFRAQLAEDRGEAVGLSLYMPHYSTTLATPGLYVQDLYIAPAARGLGLGRRLLAASARDGGAVWGATFLRLAVLRRNTGAIAFYRQLGFWIGEDDTPALLSGRAYRKLTEVR
jgi:ribosomal protein S18 acetylase RimI-like enzyme